MLNNLYRSSSIDPLTLTATKTNEGLIIHLKLLYSTPDLTILKKQKKLEIKHATRELTIKLADASLDALVYLSHNRPMFELTFEEALALCNLYVIFADQRKLKLFQELIQGE